MIPRNFSLEDAFAITVISYLSRHLNIVLGKSSHYNEASSAFKKLTFFIKFFKIFPIGWNNPTYFNADQMSFE